MDFWVNLYVIQSVCIVYLTGSSFAYSAIITAKECQGYERMDYTLLLHQIVTFLQ